MLRIASEGDGPFRYLIKMSTLNCRSNQAGEYSMSVNMQREGEAYYVHEGAFDTVRTAQSEWMGYRSMSFFF